MFKKLKFYFRKLNQGFPCPSICSGNGFPAVCVLLIGMLLITFPWLSAAVSCMHQLLVSYTLSVSRSFGEKQSFEMAGQCWLGNRVYKTETLCSSLFTIIVSGNGSIVCVSLKLGIALSDT